MTQVFKNINKEEKGLIFLGRDDAPNDFESTYLNTREKEGRLFPDELADDLPYLPDAHPLQKEWLYRAETAKRFYKYLKGKNKISSVLDLGCGNGWFSRAIKEILPDAGIYGLDINTHELMQACRINQIHQVIFLCGDVFEDILEEKTFDLIVLNSSIQYFPDVKSLIERLQELLADHGEIHILDSPIYKSSHEREAAKLRTQNYYKGIGNPEMSSHYYHHSFESFKGYSLKVMFDPDRLVNKIKKRSGKLISFFPWIRIVNNRV